MFSWLICNYVALVQVKVVKIFQAERLTDVYYMIKL